MDFSPRFLRRYLNLSTDINNAITQYCDDVRSGDFPSEDESYSE
jgi:3-methyl-2-oxobutanoate hydroxymethyltransferase